MQNVPSCLETVTIPDGFPELLQELAVEVLQNQPADVLDFCTNYLVSKREVRNNRRRLLEEREKAYLSMYKKDAPPLNDNDSIRSNDIKNLNVFILTHDKIITECELFANVEKKLVAPILKTYHVKNVCVGEELTFNEGNDSPNIYIIQHGTFQLFKDTISDQNKIKELVNKGYFGDLREKHIAVAKTPSRIVVIKKSDIPNGVFEGILRRRNDYAEFINNMKVFKNLNFYDKRVIIDSMTEKTFQCHQEIIKEGQEGKEMFIINDGFVSVQKNDKEVNNIGEGAYFGELAILDNEPRSATVVAYSTTKLLAISQDIVKSIIEPTCREQLDEQIKMYANFEQYDIELADYEEDSELATPPFQEINMPRKSVSAGRFNPELDDDDDDDEDEDSANKEQFAKTDDQRNRLRACCKNILIFRCLDEEELEVVINAMFQRVAKPGDVIIQKDDDGDNFYVVDSGLYDIIVPINGVDTVVAQYDNIGSFGELALMYNTPRSATVIAKTDGLLWAMNRDMFRKIVVKKAFKKRLMYESLLSQVSIFTNISAYERSNVADALRTRVYEAGSTIIKQGAEGLNMFFIEEGKVEIFVDYEDGFPAELIGELDRGKYFGEMALINQKPRAASIIAKTRCKIAVLDRDSFERLLGPCVDVMKRNMQNYEILTQRKSTMNSKQML